MLSLKESEKIVLKSLPDSKIKASIEYKNLHIFHMIIDRPNEQDLDPFYSVNRRTGEFRDFSVITDGDLTELTRLFLEQKKRR